MERVKRKKWSELEEETLLAKYSELLNSGTLAKLKTREKRFKPIAEHINAVHHLKDPTSYPFKWSWRDVSIKVQNMRNQYLGVKQKIRVSSGEFNWKDGEHHWENFLKYKQIFGDIELKLKDSCRIAGQLFDEEEGSGKSDSEDQRKTKKRLTLLGGQLLELRDSMMRTEERRIERDFIRDRESTLRDDNRRDADEGLEMKELEFEEMQIMWARMQNERRSRLERELTEDMQWRMKMEEKREEEELNWRERLVNMQIEHEKQMIQMQANACQNQLNILGAMARFMSLQHPRGGLSDNGKSDSNSLSEFV